MLKRAFDLGVVLLLAPVWAPLVLVTAVVVRLKLGAPTLFVQRRPGRNAKPFKIYKFRTMLDEDEADRDAPARSDAERLTDFGRRLRATSIDELPELWNVIRGDMSLVGPRPLLMEYIPLYSPEQARRHLVRPGITGLAQVSGRNATTWEERLRMDVWYVDNRSLALDVKILFLTVLRVFQRHGISAPGDATMPRFTGSND